jgi:hypothetical protein
VGRFVVGNCSPLLGRFVVGNCLPLLGRFVGNCSSLLGRFVVGNCLPLLGRFVGNCSSLVGLFFVGLLSTVTICTFADRKIPEVTFIAFPDLVRYDLHSTPIGVGEMFFFITPGFLKAIQIKPLSGLRSLCYCFVLHSIGKRYR